jgi:putative transcriptional regulator
MVHGVIQAMTINLKFKNELYASVHESATALFSVGAIDKKTMQMFDEKCIFQEPIVGQLQDKKSKKLKSRKVPKAI